MRRFHTTHSRAHVCHPAFPKIALPSHCGVVQAGLLFGASQQCIPIEIERKCICTKCRSEDILEFVKGDCSGAVTEQQISKRIMWRERSMGTVISQPAKLNH
jgi:hypothetical protein